mmetsp:Transcript_10955/g.20126  ORF Transcript_10955/g.20126 Transcript_10955/m.20126 type:complete len:794 (-) Transcript_10955:162-2543(-)|eukprot:CAMPEP_0197520580 /NCGR_PEP_ID=MMETSP1318-20131121/5922_1 /TAXON_ID=552666 /ORGANISM="Partenskyella glossopodia, Strain RCC365" /LENGTH=793 /DNA_ID=CAMNT_0043072223 /DNA_START=28 /DNA_END=2409 /DNA_ORIENTATION=-
MSDAKLFESIGIDKKKAEEAAGNSKLSIKLKQIIQIANVGAGCERAAGLLLYQVATKVKRIEAAKNLESILPYIVSGQISSSTQLAELIKQLTKGPDSFDKKTFETACGVGVVVSEQEVKDTIAKLFSDNASILKAKRYGAQGMLFGKARGLLKWADGKTVKTEFDRVILSVLGPKTAEDKKKPAKAKKQKTQPKNSDEKKSGDDEKDGPDMRTLTREELTSLFKGREIPWDKNSNEVEEAHLKRTGGRMQTRFPPEPNGYLHIGHAKAMNFNFGVAKKFGGVCYLRFDDTNPAAEKKEYIDNIIENVKFLGHDPWKITYSSDSFQKLYDFAVDLINKDKAFVCHMKIEDIRENKKLKQNQKPSPWRNRPIKESLYEFEKMRRGYYGEGEAILRLKMDITHDNPNMWDIIAYRVMFQNHPHAGDKWCIYPTYDYTHCVIDSLEDITHSCCTMEFENRRESYYWLLDELGIFKPNVWEYGRLNIESNVLSKRKLRQLVVDRHVRGWDDPRLLTINGLRRRGFTHEGINAFCDAMGVARSIVVWAPYERLEQCGRTALNTISPRRMAVLDPLKVVLTNMDSNQVVEIKCRDFPENMKELGVSSPDREFVVPLTRVCYIERKDFKPKADKSFFGLTVGKSVRLLHAYNITCERFDQDAKGTPTCVYCTIDLESKVKVKKGFLHWVSEPKPGKEPAKVTVNLYEKLFAADRPGEDDDGEKVDYLTQLNPNSLEVKKGCYVNEDMLKVKVGEHYQFERLGFFYVDPDTKGKKVVLNRTMSLSTSKDLRKKDPRRKRKK